MLAVRDEMAKLHISTTQQHHPYHLAHCEIDFLPFPAISIYGPIPGQAAPPLGAKTTSGSPTGCKPADEPWSHDGKASQPPAQTIQATLPDNADTSLLINQLYEDLVEVEALAITADEAVTQLPPRPQGKYGRTLARLYTLVGRTSGRAQGALERGEALVAMREAQLMARVPKRSPARRAR